MTERINLEVPADPSALKTVLMIVAGLSARLDYSLDDLDDVRLAMDMLLNEALEFEELDTIAVEAEVADGWMKLSAGPFRSAELRRRVTVGREDCIDLCLLLRRTMDAVSVEGDEAAYTVVLERRPREASP
jgi:hypothetical protein